MDPLDPEPPGGDTHRHDRLLVWTATAGALVCSALIFLATNSFDSNIEPVAEPVPSPTLGTATPLAASSSITTTPEPTTTTTPPPPTTTRRTTTTHAVTTTTTHPKTTTTTPRPTTTTRRCGVAAWRPDTAYDQNSVVSYNGHLWLAKWWNYNAVPGANAEGVWLLARNC